MNLKKGKNIMQGKRTYLYRPGHAPLVDWWGRGTHRPGESREPGVRRRLPSTRDIESGRTAIRFILPEPKIRAHILISLKLFSAVVYLFKRESETKTEKE